MFKTKAVIKIWAVLLVIMITFSGIPISVSADNGAGNFGEQEQKENFAVDYDPNDGMIHYGHYGEIGMRPELDDNNGHISGQLYVHFPYDVAGLLNENGERMFPDYDAMNPDPYYDYTAMFNKAYEMAKGKGDVELYVEEGVYYFTGSVWVSDGPNINGVAGKTVFVIKPNFTDYRGENVSENGFFANPTTDKYAWYQGKISDITFVVEGTHETFKPTSSAETIHANLLSDDIQSVEGFSLFYHIRMKFSRVENIALSGFSSFFRTCFTDLLTRVNNCTMGPCRIAIYGLDTNDAFFYDNYFYGGYYTKDELSEIPIFQITFNLATTVFSNSYVGNFFYSRSGAGTWAPYVTYSNITFERTYGFVTDTTATASASVSGCLFKDCAYNDIEAYFEGLGLKAYDHGKGYWDPELKKHIYPDTGYIIRDSITYSDNVARKSSANHFYGQSIPLITLHNGVTFTQNKIECDSLDWTTMLGITDSEYSSKYDARRTCGININFADNAFKINEYVKEDLFIDDWRGGKPLSEGWHDNTIIVWGEKGYNNSDGTPAMGWVGAEGPEPVCWMEDHIYVSTDLKRYVDLTAFKSPDVPTCGYKEFGEVGADEEALNKLGIREKYYEEINSGEYEIVSFEKDFGGISWNSVSNYEKFQRAFDYVATHNAILLIEEGTYYIDQPIVLRGGATYRVYSEGTIKTHKTNELSGAGAFVMSADDNAPINGYYINLDLYLQNSNTSAFYQVNFDDFYIKTRSVQRGVGCFTKCNLKDTIITEGQIQYFEYGLFYRTVTDNTLVKYVYSTGSTGYDTEEGYTPGDLTYRYLISTSDFAHSTMRGCWLEFLQFSNGRTLTGEGNSVYRGNLIDYTFNYSFGRNDVVCGNTMTRANYSSIVNHMMNSNFPIDKPDALTDKPMIMYHISDGLRLIGNMCIGTMSHETYFLSFDSHSIRYKDSDGKEVVSISNARVAGNGVTSEQYGDWKIGKPITPYSRAENIVLENCKNNAFQLQNFYFVDKKDDPETTDYDETFFITKEEVASWSVPLTKTYVNGEQLIVDYPEQKEQKLEQMITEPPKQDEKFEAPNEWDNYVSDTKFVLYDFKDKGEQELSALKELFFGFVDKRTVQVYRNSKYNEAVYQTEEEKAQTSSVKEDCEEEFSGIEAEEIDEMISAEAMEHPSEETSEHCSEEDMQEVSENCSEEETEDVTEEATEEASEEVPEEVSEKATEEPDDGAVEAPVAAEESVNDAVATEKRPFTYWDIDHLSLEERQDIYLQTILYDIKQAPDGENAFYMNQKRGPEAQNVPENCPTYALAFDGENISGESLVGVTGSFYQDFTYAYSWQAKRAPVLIFSEDENNYYGITLGYDAGSAGTLGIFYRPTRIQKNFEVKNNLSSVGDTAAWSDKEAAVGIGLAENQTYAVGLAHYDPFGKISRPNQGEQQKTVFGDYTTTPMFGGLFANYQSPVIGVDFELKYNDIYNTVSVFAVFDFTNIGVDTSVTPAMKATTREVNVGTFALNDNQKIFGLWSGDEMWLESVQFEHKLTDADSCEHIFMTTETRAGACTKDSVDLYTCGLCGYCYEEHKDAKGHDFTHVSEIISGSDSSQITYTCSVCDFAYCMVEKVQYQSCKHEWLDIEYVEESCETEGYHIRQCTVCGETESKVLPKTGHDYYKIEVEPTSEYPGFVKFICELCGHEYVEYTDVTEEDIPTDGIPNGLWCTSIEPQAYTGKAIKPEIRVYHYKTLLVKGKDYTIAYKRNVNANDASVEKTAPTIEIRGKGNYTGKVTKTFVILPKDINDPDVNIDDISVTYNKKMQKKVPVVMWNKKKLSSKKDFSVVYSSVSTDTQEAYKDPGIYTVEVNAKGNYTGKRTITLTISENILLNKAKVIHAKSLPYQGGKEVVLNDLTVTYKGKTLTEGVDYKVEYCNNTAVGTATVKVLGIGAYSGMKKSTYKITGTPIKQATVTGVNNVTYNTKTQELNLTVSVEGKVLVEDVDYSLVYTNNTKKGNAKVTIKGIGGYIGSITKTYKILPYDLLADSQACVGGLPEGELSYAYVKGGSKPKFDITFNHYELKEGKDYTISYKGNSKLTNNATLTIKGKGNFTGSAVYKFSITSKNISDVNILVPDIIYKNKKGNYISKPVLTDENGKKLTAGKDYEKKPVYMNEAGEILDPKATLNVEDKIYVVMKGKGNYLGEAKICYQLKPQEITKLKPKVIDKVYTGKEIKLEETDIIIKSGTIQLIYGQDFIVLEDTYKNNLNKGTASVTIKGVGNYAGVKTVKFKIRQKTLIWGKFLSLFGGEQEEVNFNGN